jgi:cytidine deaminase
MTSTVPPSILPGNDPSSIQQTCAAIGLDADHFAQIRHAAVQAKPTAYCPYSRFRVGAALLGADGSVTPGANVENAAYPVGTCAERVAMGRAVTEGVRKFRAVAVATDISPPASPCGMCRQL